MNVQKLMMHTGDRDQKWVYRVGSISAFVFGIAYLVIITLYLPMGAPPSDVEARLLHVAANTTAWWAILGLSVLTDFLLVPIALSLYLALKGINRNLMLLATAFVGLFIVLDLAITWANYATLITLSGHYAAATNDAQRAVFIAAAYTPAMALESNLLFVYNSLTLAVGILLTGLVMRQGNFSQSTAYLGLVTGGLGIVAVTSSFFASSVSSVSIILASVLTTVWVLLVGYRLIQSR